MTLDHSSLTPDGHVSEWFGRLMFETAEAAGVKVSEARVRIYAADLKDLPPEQVITAVRRARRDGSGFFPLIAEIFRQVGPSPDDQALLAWSYLCQAVSRVGVYASIEIEDACAAEALQHAAGSWSGFCELESGPGLMVIRQAFLAGYRDARRRIPPDALPVRLTGSLEGSGSYERVPAVWVGRLTASGQVVSERERPALPAGQAVNRLTNGDANESR